MRTKKQGKIFTLFLLQDADFFTEFLWTAQPRPDPILVIFCNSLREDLGTELTRLIEEYLRAI